MGRHGPLRWLALSWMLCGTGRRKRKQRLVEGRWVRGAGGKLALEAAGGLHRDLQMQDLKGRMGFRLAQRPCSQSGSLICAAHGTCSKAHSKINSARVGVVLNTREAQSNPLWAQG